MEESVMEAAMREARRLYGADVEIEMSIRSTVVTRSGDRTKVVRRRSQSPGAGPRRQIPDLSSALCSTGRSDDAHVSLSRQIVTPVDTVVHPCSGLTDSFQLQATFAAEPGPALHLDGESVTPLELVEDKVSRAASIDQGAYNVKIPVDGPPEEREEQSTGEANEVTPVDATDAHVAPEYHLYTTLNPLPTPDFTGVVRVPCAEHTGKDFFVTNGTFWPCDVSDEPLIIYQFPRDFVVAVIGQARDFSGLYVIKAGKKLGIFEDWDSTESCILGVSGAVYRNCKSWSMVNQYLERKGSHEKYGIAAKHFRWEK